MILTSVLTKRKVHKSNLIFSCSFPQISYTTATQPLAKVGQVLGSTSLCGTVCAGPAKSYLYTKLCRELRSVSSSIHRFTVTVMLLPDRCHVGAIGPLYEMAVTDRIGVLSRQHFAQGRTRCLVGLAMQRGESVLPNQYRSGEETSAKNV
jgi:hypothetical protein